MNVSLQNSTEDFSDFLAQCNKQLKHSDFIQMTELLDLEEISWSKN